MSRTGLVTASRMDADDARRAQFPQQMIGGYSARAVETFRALVIRALDAADTTEQELVAEIRRLSEAPPAEALSAPTMPLAQAPPASASALNILATAQVNADKMEGEARREAENLVTGANQEAARIVGEARHQADQVKAHAELQAADIIRQATEQAESERTRIINEASADARRTASGFRVLAEEMGAHLHEAAGQLAERVAEWDKRASESQASPPRRNGTHQASAKPA